MRLDEIFDDDNVARRNARLSQLVNNINKQSAQADAWRRRSEQDIPAREERQSLLKAQQDLRDQLYPIVSKYSEQQFDQFLNDVTQHFPPETLRLLDLHEYFNTHNKDAMRPTTDFWKSYAKSSDKGSLD